MGRFELRRQLWWEEQKVTRFVAAVFEGGGAKGILYRGALEAMVEDRERPWWFKAAAGASAGAITATLIAAGFRPDQIAEQTEAGRERLSRRPRRLNGILRVRNGESYLDQESLLEWLEGQLGWQVRELTEQDGGESITFKELHGLTEVELDVVAVDLVRQRPVVFNYVLTPDCQVAEAVLASAAIPLAFEPRWLLIPGRKPGSRPAGGMIVDGGVISNFPQWIFSDRSFREWAGLGKIEIPVVGFILDEQGGPEDEQGDPEVEQGDPGTRHDLYCRSVFFPSPWKFESPKDLDDALEGGYVPEKLKSRKFRERPAEPGAGARLANALVRGLAVLAVPFDKVLLDWIPAALRRNAGGEQASFPEPKNRTVLSFLHWYDSLMSAVRLPAMFIGGFVVATLVLAYGAYRVAWLPLVHLVESGVRGDTGIPGTIVGGIVLLLASVVPIYAWMLLSLAFLGGWVFHRTIQRTGYGLVRTFLQNPAAPPWAGTAVGDIVVRLPVPVGLKTLEVGLEESALETELERAREETRKMLRSLEPRPAVGLTTSARPR